MSDICYTTEKLGPNQAITPEGFLFCRSVPIARVGVMVYGPYELKDDNGNYLEAGSDGLIYVERSPEELFNDKTMSSIEGKTVTIKHPMVEGSLVNSTNWKDVSVGFGLNVRRGEGNDEDLLLADLLITSDDGIDKIINNKLREVSLGYTANYEQKMPGTARQYDIIGNHIAIVQMGRCGSRCAIKDSIGGDESMGRIGRLMTAFERHDKEAFLKELATTDEFPPTGIQSKSGGEDKPFPFKKDDGGSENKNDSDNDNDGDDKKVKDNGGGSGGTHHHHIVINVGQQGSGAAPETGGADTSPANDVVSAPPETEESPQDQGTGSPPEGGATQEGIPPGAAMQGAMGEQNQTESNDPVEMIMNAIKKLESRITALEQKMSQNPGSSAKSGIAPPNTGSAMPIKDDAHGALNEKEEAIANKTPEERQEIPGHVFLEPKERKYPVKEKKDGKWSYSRDLLLAAARRARMNHDELLAKHADEIRENEFGKDDGVASHDSESGPGPADMSDCMAKENMSVETKGGDDNSGTIESSTGQEGDRTSKLGDGGDKLVIEKNNVTKSDEGEGDKGTDSASVTNSSDPGSPDLSSGGLAETNMVTKDAKLRRIMFDKTTTDSNNNPVRIREQWGDTISRAEIVFPGIRLPEVNATLDSVETDNVICNFKRHVLKTSFDTVKGNKVIKKFVTSDSPDFVSMTNDAVNILFRAVSDNMIENNKRDSVTFGPAIMDNVGKKPALSMTPAEINELNRQWWSKRG